MICCSEQAVLWRESPVWRGSRWLDLWCWGLGGSLQKGQAMRFWLSLETASPAKHSKELSWGKGSALEKCFLVSRDRYNGIIQIDLLWVKAPGLFPLPKSLACREHVVSSNKAQPWVFKGALQVILMMFSPGVFVHFLLLLCLMGL